jgi:uncharacterized protein with PIN domain
MDDHVMSEAKVRFYAELNDFLPPARRQVAFEHPFNAQPAIKDVIEAIGVPHTEVDLILVNGVSVDFTYKLCDGDHVSVYPVFEALDLTPLVHLRPAPLRVTRFVLDVHLGRLARYLRLLGFDTRYQNDFCDDELARISSGENRILLTKDRGLLKRSQVTHGYYVRETHPRAQLVEVVGRFDLFGSIQPFQRCMRCNGLLEAVSKQELLEQIPPRTREHYDEFQRCTGCGQVYWRGSHYERMLRLIESFKHHQERVE